MQLINQMLASSSERPEARQIRLVVERRLFLKRRWRGVAEDGTEFGFDLESRLSTGCVFFQTDTNDYVIVQEPELVYEVPVDSPAFAALIGWKVGNLHFPIEILTDAVRITHDPAIAQLLEREGWEYREVTVVFNPLKAMPHAS
jgi:urease accessory protein